MLGLAYMAMKLAESRTGGSMFDWNDGDAPLERSLIAKAKWNEFPCTREYYAICDRITRGEKP